MIIFLNITYKIIMGAANCCKKPDEIVIEEIKYSAAEGGNTDNDKMNAIDKDGYPQDTEQVYKSNVRSEEENQQVRGVSNQNLYEQEGASPKIGGAYEVPINTSSPEKMYEQAEGEAEGEAEGYEQNESGSPQQNENQQSPVDQYDENANQETVNSPISGDANIYQGNPEEEGIDYNTYAMQNENGADLNALTIGNSGANISSSYAIQQSTNSNLINQKVNLNNYSIKQKNEVSNLGGIDLNSLGSETGVISSQQGAIDLNTLALRSQQGGLGMNHQQTTTTTTSISNNGQIDLNKLGLGQETSQINGNNEFNKYFQQTTTQYQSVNSLNNNANIASVTPISGDEDISKYFKQTQSMALPNVQINLNQFEVILILISVILNLLYELLYSHLILNDELMNNK